MIKAYTDLVQCKMLANILPLESADVYLQANDPSREHYSPYYGESIAITIKLFLFRTGLTIPCWSLAALFDALPKTIGQYNKYMGYFDDSYHCDYLDEDCESVGFGTSADNLIDAVFKMITVLKDKGIITNTNN